LHVLIIADAGNFLPRLIGCEIGAGQVFLETSFLYQPGCSLPIRTPSLTTVTELTCIRCIWLRHWTMKLGLAKNEVAWLLFFKPCDKFCAKHWQVVCVTSKPAIEIGIF